MEKKVLEDIKMRTLRLQDLAGIRVSSRGSIAKRTKSIGCLQSQNLFAGDRKMHMFVRQLSPNGTLEAQTA